MKIGTSELRARKQSKEVSGLPNSRKVSFRRVKISEAIAQARISHAFSLIFEEVMKDIQKGKM